MVDREALFAFVEPYYADKDIMHNMWHIELVEKKVEQIIAAGGYRVDRECLLLATWFHGFVYRDEGAITKWLREQGYTEEKIQRIIQIAWESQRKEVPESLEGRILHDAHVLEGGKTYLVVKTLITGSVRGQSLLDTIRYMEENVLEKNVCYLPETIPQCEEMNAYAEMFVAELRAGIA